MAYEGSIDLISGIRPKNNGEFPLVNAKDVYVNDSERLDARLAATRDALTYTKEWVETLTPDDRGSGKTYITFKPTGFGARSNFRLKSFTIMSSDVSSYLPSQPVYAKVLDPEATAHAKAVSRPVSVTDTNTNYTFVFDESEELVYNKQYKMIFSQGAADGSPLLIFGVRVHNATEDQDIYYENFPRMKPITRWVYSYNSLVTGVNAELDSKVPTTRTINNKELSADISLDASDVGAIPATGGTVTGDIELSEGGYSLSPDVGGCIKSSTGQYIAFPSSGGELALTSDMYAAVQQIAPEWSKPESGQTGTTYTKDISLCTYNGVLYQCANTYTTVSSSKYPPNDIYDSQHTDGHWVVKKVSDLFLPLAGGEMIGELKGKNISAADDYGGFLQLHADSAGTFFLYRNGWNGASSPIYQIYLQDAHGTLALLQNLAEDFSSSATYDIGDLCVRYGQLYRCTTAITTPESWDYAHWTEATIEDVLAAIRTALDGKLGNSGAQTLNNGSLTIEASSPFGVAAFEVSGYDYKVGISPDRLLLTSHGHTFEQEFQFKEGVLALLADTLRFSTNVAYAVGDVVFYSGSFYRCITAHKAGAWNASHFTEVIGGLSTGTPTVPDIGQNAPDGQIANKKYVDTLVDTVSPLVARSFTVPKNGDDGYGGASTIFFYPRYLGMSNGDRMKSFIVRRRISGGPQTAVSVYVELQDSSGATLATTKTQTLPAELGVYVSFEFPESVAILNKDAQYRLVFYDANSPSSPYTANLNFYQYPQNNPDCYFGTYSRKFVPDLTVQYYAWASDLVPTSRKVNGHALTEDVTLTANNIDYAIPGGSQSVQITLEALETTKLGKTGAQTLDGRLEVNNSLSVTGEISIVGDESLATITTTEDALMITSVASSTAPEPSTVAIPLTRGDVATFMDVLDAVRQIAPEFDATRTESNKYKQYELVSKNGVVYQCTKASGHYGAWNASNWTAKKVSELFLPLTGGEMTGGLTIGGLTINTDGSLSYDIGAVVREINLPQHDGTLALTKEIPYPIREVALTVASGTASGTLYDHCVNTVSVDYGYEVSLTLPEQVAGKSRDFFVRFVVTGSGGPSADWTIPNASFIGSSFTPGLPSGDYVFHFTEILNGTVSPSANPVFLVTGQNDISALARKAPLTSPAFTGAPTAPTPNSGNRSTRVATTAFVQGALPYSIATKSISNNAVVADDRTVNFVDATSQTGTLTLLMPLVQTSGKSRDFYFAIKCGATPPTVTAPYSPINTKGETPDLTLTSNATTVLRFTEVANGSTGVNPVFVVTGGANGGGSIDPATLNAKLNSTSAAPAFSDSSSVTYAVGDYVTYNGDLYVCSTATTGGTWDSTKWTAANMTSPDATFDVTSQNALRLVDANGNRLWMQGYNLETPTVTSGAATLSNESVNYIELASTASANATVTLSLPARSTGKVSDFVLDVANKTTDYALTLALDSTALDTTFGVVVPDGDDLTTMFTVAAGEMAEFYFTLTQFTKTPTGGSGTIPMYKVVKQVVVDATEVSA